ncbi:helicase RepA family protein [Roseovarius sp. CAU 1744]|uniref:AAA family ATPase n=1 Tax=Roseovarius sp. CAU 1744 TaxID=3140368 RepID=UPI00325C1622
MSMSYPPSQFLHACPVTGVPRDANFQLRQHIDDWFPRLPWDEVEERHQNSGDPFRWNAKKGENTLLMDGSDFGMIMGPDYANDLDPLDVIAFALDVDDEGQAWDWVLQQFPPEPEKARDRADSLFDQLSDMPDVEPSLSSRHLVKGWIDASSASVVYGESNVGKTFFVTDLAAHVAAGLDWHGVPVAPNPAQEAVIYVAAEGGHGIKGRVKALSLDRPELSTRAFKLLPTTLDFFRPTDAVALIDMARRNGLGVRMVVLDTLARTMGEGDENTAKDMGKYIANIDALRQSLGCHVMVVHHSGKDTTKGARGSGSLRAAVDTEIELQGEWGITTAAQRKQRDMQMGEPFAFSLRTVALGKDEDGEDVTSAVIEPAEVRRNTANIAGAAGIALSALDALIERGETEPMSGNLCPSDRSGVRLEVWRKECRLRRLSQGEGESAERTAFGRAKGKLAKAGIIGEAGEWVWRKVND